MSKFNFDSEFFRRVISGSEKTVKPCSLSGMVKKAVDVFFDEYDYYPDLGVFAPGTFTIMGDHLEYEKGNLIQAALPLGTVIVGKSMSSVKCRLFTSSRSVEGLKKSVFPIAQYKKNVKVFPDWVNYIKGVINCFPDQDIRGFDAVIHSNVPVNQGCGSSAALQVGFYTFLEVAAGAKSCEKKEIKGKLCYLLESEMELCEKKIGKFSNFTSAVASPNTVVGVNCRTMELSTHEMRDINLIFLLTFPNFPIELNDRDYIDRRKIELHLAARLLGLTDIIDATEYHLSVLENMNDPSREEVTEILRDLGLDEDYIKNFVEELFYFPHLDFESEEFLHDEGYFDTREQFQTEDVGLNKPQDGKSKTELENKVVIGSCVALQSEKINKRAPSYIRERIAELCAGKEGSDPYLIRRVCEEINCLGGVENLSTESELTVCGKLQKRVRHIVTENMRSLAFSDLSSELDYEEFGAKLIQSHLSLKLDYEVSCHTLDSLVQLAIDSDRVYGAKMTSGGGTLTLLHRSVAEKFIEKVTEKFGEDFQFYLVFPSSGAKILNMGVRSNPKSTLSNALLNRDQLVIRAIENFEATYKYRPTHGAYSPGTINLMGNYTDYNHGFCLSLATNLTTVVVGALNGTSNIRVVTTADVGSEKPRVIFPVPESDEVKPGRVNWSKLVKGAASHYNGFIKGFDSLIESTLPCRSGLSSKSTLVMAFYTFLEVLSSDKKIRAVEKAQKCLLAIQEFYTTLNSINELLVQAKSKEDFAVFVDCRSLTTTLIPFQDPSVAILITFAEEKNSRSNRALLFSRMADCNEVAKALGSKSLRCATLKDLDDLKLKKKKVPERSIRRAVHIITENERVLKAAEALKNNDFDTLGELMVASHNSLRDNYEMSTPELDRLVASAMEVDGVLGSKAPSSGSRICIISLVKRWAIDDLIEYLINSTSRKLINYFLTSSENCGSLELKNYLDKLPSSQFAFEHIFPF